MQTLLRLLSDCLNVEAYDIEALVAWLNKEHHTPEGRATADKFKAELEHAITNTGSLTPDMYARQTCDEKGSQEQIQEQLQLIWNACFAGGDLVEPLCERIYGVPPPPATPPASSS